MKFGFTGEVVMAKCQCHKGMFAALVFLVVPGEQRQLLDNKEFKTEKEAEEALDQFVHDTAKDFLNSIGLEPDEAHTIEKHHGEAALAAEQRVQREGNTTLH